MSALTDKEKKITSFILVERLKELRKENSFTQAEVASKLEIPRSTYSGYEKGIREAGYDTLVKFAQLFNVSIDYLLGISNERRNEEKNLCEVIQEDRLHWNGIPLTESDLKLIYDLLENVISERIKRENRRM